MNHTSTQPKHQPAIIDQVLSRGVETVLPDKKSLAQLMKQKRIRVYLGIDPTGNLLHLGHAVVLRKLQQLADLGHDVILLIGNGTVKIGDPTGKDESRPMLTDEEIEQNWQNWKEQASTILDFKKITIKRNGEWLDKLNYADIVKLLAKTTVQQLLERDMFQERMNQGRPIFGHEIIYPLLQGYDSVVMDVDLEIGGSDQTFNMMMGRTLQKVYNNREKWVLTTPLIEGTDGRKMSKSYGNFIALTAEPEEIYGKLMSLKDELIIKYFELLTDVSPEEIKQMEQAMQTGTNPMEFKKRLALTITSDLHDEKQAQQAQDHFETTVQAGEIPAEMPEITLNCAQLPVLEILQACQPDESNSQLKRLCEQSAVRLMPQDKKLSDPLERITVEDGQVIKIGKRNFYRLKVE
jgi:tyrosyl-tRNA synthetase